MKRILMTAAAVAIAMPAAVFAQSAEDVAEARRGLQKLFSLEMAGLSPMVRNEAPYDAEKAQFHADNLVSLASYKQDGLLMEGTSKADLPGKTRAEAKIWDDLEGYAKLDADFVAAVAELQGVAGQGLEALTPVFQKVGGTCRACHEQFRAEDF